MRHIAAALLAILAAGVSPGALPAPHIQARSFDQLAKPLPLPYDTRAAGMAQVDAARARAKVADKLLLIDLGGNWCLDCRILAGTVALPDLAPWVARHYELVTVDIGRYDHNLDVPAHYGLKDRLAGVPSLLVIDPASDRLLNPGRTTALADARHMTPQALADWLAQWAR